MTAATIDQSQGADLQAQMQAVLDKQRQSYLKDGPPSYEQRMDRLQRSVDMLLRFEKEMCDAVNSDFGSRSPDQTLFTDVAGSIGPIKHTMKHLKGWMKSEKRKVQFPLGLLGAKARIDYQPLGVVGVISPWNFPFQLTFAPFAGIFGAGNRMMIKPSEFTPASSEVIARMCAETFDETEVSVFTGGPEVGQAFSGLGFDHLLFTGATSIAKHVMRAASENLVPLTLELGGKSPVVVSETADLDVTAKRVMVGKTLNAGQICLAPDYVYVPDGKVDEFVNKAEAAVTEMYPTLKDNPDYASVVNERHYDRLNSYIEDAKAKGATVREINPANEDFSQQAAHKIPPTIVVNATDDMKIMQDEIFGPLLPIKTYKQVDEVIDYVNEKDRPLALYYFGENKAEENHVLNNTTSGGVSVNEVIMHVAQEDLPFGGVGPAGMGAYHGVDGFRQFSHKKAVFTQIGKRFDGLLNAVRPPYGPDLRKMAEQMMK
ncbi:MAG: coniferyl aldehyde dehydrogenase [Alphaproteobacteria bacterium]